MDVEINFGNQKLKLLPSKSIYWKDKKTLLFSDLHLGKAESFQSLGVPLPSGGSENDIKRIEDLFISLSPKELWILGDFIHSKSSLNQKSIFSSFLELLERYKVHCTVILGNHDRSLMKSIPSVLKGSQIEFVHDFIESADIIFSHDQIAESKKPVVSGHIHPVITLAGGTDSVRLPCFHKSMNNLILPAFSSLAGGYEIHPKKNDSVFVVAEDNVIRWQ